MSLKCPKVVHLEMLDAPGESRHYYYSNVKALYDKWPGLFGFSYSYLNRYKLQGKDRYETGKFIIRIGRLIGTKD